MWLVAGCACLFAILRSRSATVALVIGVGYVVWTSLLVGAVRTDRYVWQIAWFFATGLAIPALIVAVIAATS
jgi:hypothetical protein